MTSFPKKTALILGLMGAVTTIGVYSATANSVGALERPALLQGTTESPNIEAGQKRVIRIVGPQFLPDNGDVKLLGAAAERARRPDPDLGDWVR